MLVFFKIRVHLRQSAVSLCLLRSSVPLRFKGLQIIPGGAEKAIVIQIVMRQPTDQQERNEDKKKSEENPSRGIDPETKEPEMEANEPEKKKDAA